MIYSITCGTCYTNNTISAISEPIIWDCSNCKNNSMTSLPCNPDKTLITDYTKAKSILDPTSASKVVNPKVGILLSQYEAQQAEPQLITQVSII